MLNKKQMVPLRLRTKSLLIQEHVFALSEIISWNINNYKSISLNLCYTEPIQIISSLFKQSSTRIIFSDFGEMISNEIALNS
jgi:hypothetical protein